MRIVGSSSSMSTRARQVAHEVPDDRGPEAPRNALIAIEPPRRNERSPRSTHYPSASFVAHLIATRMQAAQTRERRRAEPEEAIAVYRSMTKPVIGWRPLGMRI